MGKKIVDLKEGDFFRINGGRVLIMDSPSDSPPCTNFDVMMLFFFFPLIGLWHWWEISNGSSSWVFAPASKSVSYHNFCEQCGNKLKGG